MKYINKFNKTSDFENAKSELKNLEHYLVYDAETDKMYLKKINTFYVTTNNVGTTIYKRTDNANGKETVTLNNGENKLTDWNYGFYFDKEIATRKTSNNQDQITSFNLRSFDTSKVTDMNSMFRDCNKLTSLDLSNFDTSKVTDMSYMFRDCNKLTYIKCKQTFKDWCWTNQDTIELPTEMRDGGSGHWEIVDASV